MKIKYQSIEKLTRWEAFQLFSDVLALALAAKDGKAELYVTVLTALQLKYNVLDDVLVQEKNTSSLLPDADEARDYGVRKIHAIALEYADYRVSETLEVAANTILTAFKPYGTGSQIARMAQDAQTGVLTNLLQDLDKDTVKQAIATLRLTDLVEYTATNNEQFSTEKLAQVDEKSQFIAGAVKTARSEATDALKKFCETVNALIIVEGAATYETLVPQINTRIQAAIATANQRIERARAEKKKKGAEKEENESPAEPNVVV